MAGNHASIVQIGPDRGEVFFFYPQHVDALTAGDFHRRNVEFLHHIGDGAQFLGAGHAAPHARHDGIGAVLLDVGVHAFVDEARLAVVHILTGPGGQQIIVQGRPALGAAGGGFPFQRLHQQRDGFQFLGYHQPAHVVVAQTGAAAHGLHGGGIISVAQGQRQELLNEAGAAAAARRRLGVGADIVQRRQAAFDGRGDLAFAHAVAAADLRLRRQCCNGRHRVRASSSCEAWTENKGFALLGDVRAFFQHVEQPGAVAGFAVEHHADDTVVFQDKAFVDPARGVAQYDLLAVRRLGEVTGGEQIDAGHFQLGRGGAGDEAGIRFATQLRGGDAGHLIQGCHQPIGLAQHFGAFAEREYVGVGGAHAGVRDDAAIDGEAGFLRQRGIRADADGHHHQGCRQFRAISQKHAGDTVFAQNRLGVGAGEHLDTARFDRRLQQMAGGGIELPFHQSGHEVDDGDIHALLGEAGGGFQPQQAAADDHRLAARFGGQQHGLHVVEITVGQHTRQLVAGHRDDDGDGAGGNNEFVVIGADATRAGDGLGHRVDGGDGDALVQHHAVLHVPAIAVDDDFLKALFARQEGREHDAVIIHPRLGVENGDVVSLRGGLKQAFERPSGGHAVADDNEFLTHSLVRPSRGPWHCCWTELSKVRASPSAGAWRDGIKNLGWRGTRKYCAVQYKWMLFSHYMIELWTL